MKLLIFCVYFILVECSCPFSSESKRDNVIGGRSALLEANQFMHQQYSSCKKMLSQKIETFPLIIVNTYNDSMTLTWNGKKETVGSITTELYTNLKMVTHSVLNTLLMLEPTIYLANDTEYLPLSPDVINTINQYYSLLISANSSLNSCCNFSTEVLSRQYIIFSRVVGFLNKVKERGVINQQELYNFGNNTQPIIEINIQEASIDMVNFLHSKVMTWKRQMNEGEWSNLRVIIMAEHMPRQDFLHMQYFAKLLHTDPQSGLRVVYAENVVNEEDAYDLLMTHLVDFTAGQVFWENADHMHKDITASAVRKYLPNILP